MKNYYETIADCKASIAGNALDVPKGTKLVHVPNAGTASGYAVKYPAKLGVDKHDATYYYAYVPARFVFAAVHVRKPLAAKSNEWKDTANAWRVSIAGQEFEYYTGSAIEKAPSYDDVMASLLLDSAALGQEFEEWAQEYGFDADSRKAHAIWEACCDNARKLIKTGIDIEAESERLRDH